MSGKRVIVAMSGGVDSSVAALLLREAGYQVAGVTMRLWTPERPDAPVGQRRCCGVEDIEDARRACQVMSIPHYVLNAEREFHAFVVDYFVREYQRGRTPHPCIACNDRIKFDFLLRRAMLLGADFIATGHYARVDGGVGGLRLLKGIDPAKDQSYVLFGLPRGVLGRVLLPVGGYTKARVRALARAAGLPNADKPDSQEICFIPQGDYRQFLAQRVKPTPGEITDSQGRVLGQHRGIEFFTIGQRRGLGVAAGAPLYVVGLDLQANQVIVGPEEELYQTSLWASGVNWLAGAAPAESVEVTVKIRYKAPEVPATLLVGAEGVEVRFHQPQRAVTPGQAVVFYLGEEVLGGGFIEAIRPGGATSVVRELAETRA
ncbi:MAG: tRNA 2-thiouridine(34) synthase MnmA [Chloroflexi bacterium]|nr:tRNA 2-thiouridine(34) synthase MnmA [Chloroflexota bacterium]